MLPPFPLLPLLPPPFTLPPAPAAPVPAGGVGVVQPLRLCSFVLVPPFVWAAFVCAHRPSFVIVSVCPCSFVPAQLYWLALVLVAARLHSFAGPRSCLAFARARLVLIMLVWVYLRLFGFRSCFDGFLFGLPSLSFVSISNIYA